MSIIQHQSSQQRTHRSLFPWSTTTYPSPKSDETSPSPSCSASTRTRSYSEPNTPTAIHHGLSFRLHFSQTIPISNVRYERTPEQRQQHQQRREPKRYEGPRSFEIITPSGRKQQMIFVERVSHITAQVEYGLIPADPKSRKYDEQGFLLGNEGMELLSPKVYEDTPRGAFFFAERRPTAKPSAKPEQGKKSTGQKPGERKEKKNEEKGEKDLPGIPAVIPTLLDQLVKLRVLRIIPNIRCRSIQHSGACLVRILLSDSEVGHSCSSPRHTYVLYEAPNYTRFKVCTACRTIPNRHGVYYCSEPCLSADWPFHRVECGKTREELYHIISMLPTIIKSKPPLSAHLRTQTHRPAWHRTLLWWSYAAESEKNNVIDLEKWKTNVKERKAAGCRDFLPGF